MHAEIASGTGETSATCHSQPEVANGFCDLHVFYVKNNTMQEILPKETHFENMFKKEPHVRKFAVIWSENEKVYQDLINNARPVCTINFPDVFND